jgi:hypothetical protein
MSHYVAKRRIDSRRIAPDTIEKVFSFVQFCSVPHKKKDRRDPFTESRRPWFVAADRKPNSVSPFRKRRPFLCGICCQTPEASLTSPCDLPADQASRAGTLRIFGLAAGGVCRAGDVTTAAVRSYRTISPLPGRTDQKGVRRKLRVEKTCSFYFLLSPHSPLGGTPRRFLSVALSVGSLRLGVTKHRALCSSDFPHRKTSPRRDRRICRNGRIIA